jgi:hypothetical protein
MTKSRGFELYSFGVPLWKAFWNHNFSLFAEMTCDSNRIIIATDSVLMLLSIKSTMQNHLKTKASRLICKL